MTSHVRMKRFLPERIRPHVGIPVKIGNVTSIFVPFATGFTRRASVYDKVNNTDGLAVFHRVVTPQIHGFFEDGFYPFLFGIPEFLHESRLVPMGAAYLNKGKEVAGSLNQVTCLGSLKCSLR